MFLKQVKVKRFAKTVKKYGPTPWNIGWQSHYKVLEKEENNNPDEVYTIVGVTNLQEGYAEYEGMEEGYRWQQKAHHKVYLVAKSLGRRFKVLEEDLELI